MASLDTKCWAGPAYTGSMMAPWLRKASSMS